MEQIIVAFLVSLGFNLGMFFPAYFLGTDTLTDISYALSFLFVSGYLFFDKVTEVNIMAWVMVAAWAVRLGTYLLIRILRMKEDKRFDTIRHSFGKFLGFWLLQGSTVFIVLLPLIFLSKEGHQRFVYTSFIGVGIYALGLIIESVADHQKYVFKSNPANKGQWIACGLWGYSRHPNYLGEILVWGGVYAAVLPYLSFPYTFIALLSPLYIFSLLVLVSGIPRLERAADERWGKDPAYQAYKKKTSVLFPFL